ncbi:MAG: 30S ribosomal protein S27ae [DPANN group archaeon]|nr:30S ribosomal protein S27ae [DPANN group archaeon]
MAKEQPKKDKPKKGVWQLYEVKGDTLVRKNPWSPKKGPGSFMADHKNRQTCGASGYTEFKKKGDE